MHRGVAYVGRCRRSLSGEGSALRPNKQSFRRTEKESAHNLAHDLACLVVDDELAIFERFKTVVPEQTSLLLENHEADCIPIRHVLPSDLSSEISSRTKAGLSDSQPDTFSRHSRSECHPQGQPSSA